VQSRLCLDNGGHYTIIIRVENINHKGIDIVRIDFTGCTNLEGILPIIEEAKKKVTAKGQNGAVTLTLLSGMRFNSSMLSAVKEYMAFNRPYVKKGAVVGIDSALMKVAYTTTTSSSDRSFNVFDSESDALEYLTTG